MLSQFATVVIFLGLGLVLCGLMLGLGSLLRPSNPQASKLSTYECGEPPGGAAWIHFNIRFDLLARVFVIFDVELAFVYPVAAVFKEWREQGRGEFAFVELTVFLGILMVGLLYVWIKGDLEWLQRIPAATPAAKEPARRAA